ncbi:HlyU family transcriptional regulator [Oceaniglobus indicus]|uniref:HlyU family transcriptional regulator n=1 Tax=Oceaniglobus indicus TaxID=2047749 RepID=UPI000C18CA45|nr:HlyU family transcriptional regulator [Oceaniglobus indicus]
MSILKRLFGGKPGLPAEAASEAYGDYRIVPDPIAEGAVHRLAARIEKDTGDQTKVHRMIRADTFQNRDQAIAAAIVKAKQVIDEQGDDLFD